MNPRSSSTSQLPPLPADPQEIESYLSAFTNFEKEIPLSRHRRTLGPLRARSLLTEAGLLPPRAPVIQVAGTKGKGSMVLWMESLLEKRGVLTAAAISPHLEHLGERVRVGGRPSSPGQLLQALERLHPPLERLIEKDVSLRPTFFDLLTAAAIARADSEEVGAILLEVGLGGPLDSTSAVPHCCGILTCVDLDHCEFLGDSVEEIAREKAGIARKGMPFLIPESGAPWQAVARSVARQRGAKVMAVGIDSRVPSALVAPQRENLSLALQAIETTFAIQEFTREEIEALVVDTTLPGRLEEPSEKAPFLLDSAHTFLSLEAFTGRFESWREGRRGIVLLGMLSDKRWQGALAPLLALQQAPEIWLVAPPSRRAWDLAVAARFIEGRGVAIETWEDVEAALTALRRRSLAGDPVAVTGSVTLAGATRRWWRAQDASDD